MRPLALGLLLAAALLLALAAQAPARLAGYLLADSGARMEGFSGTLWRGRASSLAVPVAGQHVQLGATEWRLSPWRLLGLTASAELRAAWGRQTLVARLSVAPWRSARLDAVELVFSARLARLLMPVELRGMLTLSARRLEWSGAAVEGSGKLVWRGAAWQGNRARQDLGDYALEFDVSERRRLRGQVRTLRGPVKVEGGVELDLEKVKVNLRLSGEEPLADEFLSALSLLAVAIPEGHWIQLEYPLPAGRAGAS